MSDIGRYIPRDIIREYEEKAIANRVGWLIKATSEFESSLNSANSAGADISESQYLDLQMKVEDMQQVLYGLGDCVRTFQDNPEWGLY